jgi:hypothetical protein
MPNDIQTYEFQNTENFKQGNMHITKTTLNQCLPIIAVGSLPNQQGDTIRSTVGSKFYLKVAQEQ